MKQTFEVKLPTINWDRNNAGYVNGIAIFKINASQDTGGYRLVDATGGWIAAGNLKHCQEVAAGKLSALLVSNRIFTPEKRGFWKRLFGKTPESRIIVVELPTLKDPEEDDKLLDDIKAYIEELVPKTELGEPGVDAEAEGCDGEPGNDIVQDCMDVINDPARGAEPESEAAEGASEDKLTEVVETTDEVIREEPKEEVVEQSEPEETPPVAEEKAVEKVELETPEVTEPAEEVEQKPVESSEAVSEAPAETPSTEAPSTDSSSAAE